jgi:hypothetical protein
MRDGTPYLHCALSSTLPALCIIIYPTCTVNYHLPYLHCALSSTSLARHASLQRT